MMTVLSFINSRVKNSLQVKSVAQCALLIGTLGFGVQAAQAGQYVDQLSDCLETSMSAQDRSTVVQWMFVALSAHPDLKNFSQVTAEQKASLDQKLAGVLQSTLAEKCAAQTKAVIQNEGLQSVADSFQGLGQTTGKDILNDPAVNAQLRGTLRYIDLNKLAATFLTPDIFSKFIPMGE
jgi:hypothetical protein